MRFCSTSSALYYHFVAMTVLRKCNRHIQNPRSKTESPVLFVCNNVFYEADTSIVPCQIRDVNRITSRYNPAVINSPEILNICICFNFFPDFFTLFRGALVIVCIKLFI